MQSVLTIWQTDSLYKVLREKEYEKKDLTSLNVKLYANEAEGVRFYCTPKRDVSLDVEISEISGGAGKEAISIEVGYVLYVPITRKSAGTNLELGDYPDALLPFKTAKEYGKNHVQAHCNQEIWITAHTRADTPAGTYTATVAVIADGERYEIPLTITVWDYALPVENHTKQYFIIDAKHLELVEGGGLAHYKRYFDDLFQYRVNGSKLPYINENDYKTVAADFIEQLIAYYPEKRLSFVNLPVFYTPEYDDVAYEETEYVFREVVKAGIEQGVNYFTKAVTYLWILDEPHLSPTRAGYCRKVLPKFEKMKRKIAADCKAKAVENPLYGEMADCLYKMPNIITVGVMGSIMPQDPDDYEITWCPAFPAQDEAVTMWKTLNKGEKWWYGCNWPVPPYPTYHIDDKLLSSRLVSWMQYSYEVTGNLYWRINYWARKKDDELVYVDPYAESTYTTTNGEGMLIYPGKPFGLDSFVSSIRMESVRDGIEDFEALYSLEKEIKRAAGKNEMIPLSVNELLSPVYTRLFDRTLLPESLLMPFEEAREIVAELLTAAKAYDFAVTKRADKTGEFAFFTTAEAVVVDGDKLQGKNGVYVATCQGEKITVILNGGKGERRVTLYLRDAERPFKCSLTDNWSATAEKYGIETDPKGILQPYYNILSDESVKNYAPCCIDLGQLVSFVWRTEAVIVKETANKQTKVTFFMPKGKFTTKEEYEEKELDETGRAYTITTEKSCVEVEAETEKGVYPLKLYL